MLKKMVLIASIVSMSPVALSQTVAPNTFSTGGDILASEMNANFDAMESGIDSNTANITTNTSDVATNAASITANTANVGTNTSDIAALVARIDALEASSSSSVVGRSYHLIQIGMLNRGDESGGITVGNMTQTYTLTLSDDATFTFVGTENETEVNSYTGEVTSSTGNYSDTGTYAQVGETLTLSWSGGGTIVFKASLDGSVLAFNDFGSRSSDGGSWFRTSSSFIVGVEIQP